MGLLSAYMHPPRPMAAAGVPEFTQRMAQTGQLQQGMPQPMQQAAQPTPPQPELWRFLGGPEGGALTAAGFPWLQQQVLSALAQYPQKTRTHTLGGGS